MTENIDINKTDFFPVRIDTVGDDTTIDFDLYCYESNRYFLFCAANSNFKKVDLSRTYIQRTKYLYTRREQKKNYRRYVEKNLPALLLDENMKNSDKVDIIYDVSTAMASEVYTENIIPEKGRVFEYVKNVMDFMFSKKLSLGELVKFAEHDFYTYNHSLHVFIYSSMFASFLNLKDPKMLASISQGAFLHDIGKSKVKYEIINKPGPLDKDEWFEMQQHPVFGHEIARDKMEILDPNILSIILNHHERIDGQGYPGAKTALDFPEKLVGIVDTYDAITSTRSYQLARKPFDALKYMMQTQSKKLDVDLLQKFAIMLGSK